MASLRIFLGLLLVLSFASAEKGKIDPQCRGVTGENDEGIETFTADVVLVGSGPAGAGFLHRLVRLRPDLSVLWIEKGLNFKAYNWPEDIVDDTDTAVLTNIPRRKLTHIAAKAWNNFGGGDAANSGGANYLVSDEPYPPVDVFELRNNTIIPGTETTDRWIKAFEASNFKYGPPAPIKLDDKELVSLPSSLRTPDGRDRLLVADDLRYNTVNRNVQYVYGRAASVIRVDGRAIGIRGVRMTNKQREYGGCVAWKANLAVVLSAGIFNTFDLLVESGIGKERHLEAREVPKDWWTPNEDVGTGVGDEHAVVYLDVDPEAADPFGAQPRLIAEDLHGSAYEFWTKGVETWLKVKNLRTYVIINDVLPKKIPKIMNFLSWVLKGCSFWGIGLLTDPILELDAVPKAKNATQRGEWFLEQPPFYNNPFSVLKMQWFYKKNQLGIIVDDTKIEVNDTMCEAINRAMEPLKEGSRLQNAVKNGQPGTRRRRLLLKVITKLGPIVALIFNPRFASYWNADEFGKRCKNKKKDNTDMLASYWHYYGGNGNVVDDSYQVKGTKDLYIADASVLKRLTAGPTTPTSMQVGMRVADAFVANLGEGGDDGAQ